MSKKDGPRSWIRKLPFQVSSAPARSQRNQRRLQAKLKRKQVKP